MKALSRSILVLILSVCVFACTEVPPYINYSPDVLLSKDTCYIIQELPDAQLRNVLVEDISGVRCSNCPDAAEKAHAIDEKHEGRVVIATLHPTSQSNLTTPWGDDDFRTQEAENIYANLIGAVTGLPTGAISRRKFSAEPTIAMTRHKWMAYAEEILSETSVVNLELLSEVDTTTREVNLDVKTTFIEEDETPVHLTIMVLESGIIQPQTDGVMVDTFYTHNDILRFTHTLYNGIVISDNPQRGLVCEKEFNIKIPEEIVLENVSIAVLVNKLDANNKEVLQCTEVHLSE